MFTKTELPTLREQELVIATFDLTSYFRFSRTRPEREVMTLTSDYYQFVGDIIAETAVARITERGATRADDRISEAGMEDRKRTGYF